jgi:hypothetical protein
MGCLKFGHRSSGSQANTPLGKENWSGLLVCSPAAHFAMRIVTVQVSVLASARMHGRNWAPTAFSLRDDVSCRHRSNRQPPHCNSCFLTVGSLSAFASINANRVAAKHTYERGISRRRREYAEIACAQRSHLYEILDQGALGSHRQRLAHLHLS